MAKQIINGPKILLMKVLNKKNILFVVALIASTHLYTTEPIAYLNSLGYEPAQKEMASSKNGMITTQHFLATQVGEKILNRGGNAYDASIAVAFTLAVVLPRAGNIGGGGFMVIYDKETEQPYTIDFREKAPELSTKDMYLNKDGSFNDKNLSTVGYLAIGVPGTVAGLWEVHQKFGSLPWNELIEDAIYYAENGFEITPFLADILLRYSESLSLFAETKEIFQLHYPNFKNKTLVQKDLANTLKIIASNGRKGFYEGEIAEKISSEIKKNNGLISKSDLKNYSPVWREPLISNYRDTEIITMGPPSSGGLHVIQMLNILENYDLKKIGHNSLEYINLLTEVMKFAYADRSKYLGDPDFYDVPIKKIISKKYANDINKNIQIGKLTPVNEINPGKYMDGESHETTHFSVVDKTGNVISMTYTLNSTFGSKVVIEGTGILMNNEMDDFSAAPGIPNQFNLLGAEANEIAPFKRPLSSMTPTIVLKDKELFFTTGSPGGARIISAVLQSIVNIIDFNMNLEDTTAAKRIHHQWYPDILEYEFTLDNTIEKNLKKMGYKTESKLPLTCLQTIMFSDGMYYGYGDFRRVDALASGNIND
jgi:gamma-glutamyltranspeptidase/glutathione hydrolase|tara:strand:+ start:2504 stop:4288 length:1785 start_codon:yes stop_codon:yes gene_type:complete